MFQNQCENSLCSPALAKMTNPRVHFEVKNMKQKLIQLIFTSHSVSQNLLLRENKFLKKPLISQTFYLISILSHFLSYALYLLLGKEALQSVNLTHYIWKTFSLPKIFCVMHRILLDFSGNIWTPVLLC